jgi:hypothetical protein
MNFWMRFFQINKKTHEPSPYRKFWRHPCAIPISGGGKILNLSAEGAQIFLREDNSPTETVLLCAPQLSPTTLKVKVVWSSPYKNGYLMGIVFERPTLKIYSYLTLLSRLDRLANTAFN